MSSGKRILSLLPSATEIVCGLGMEEDLVGVSHECDFPRSLLLKPRVTSCSFANSSSSLAIDRKVKAASANRESPYSINADLIRELEPDLILTQSQCDVCAIRFDDVLDLVEQSPRLSNTRVVGLNPHRVADLFDDIMTIAQAAGCRAVGERFAGEIRRRIYRVRQATYGVAQDNRPRVACVEWLKPLMLAGNWGPELVDYAGGIDSLNQPGEHSAYVKWKVVRDYDPQVLIIAPCGFELRRTRRELHLLTDLSGWGNVSAVQDDRVFLIDGNAYFNRSGPRLVESLEILVNCVHPDRSSLPESMQQGKDWDTLTERT